jgi:hypothetical protein
LRQRRAETIVARDVLMMRTDVALNVTLDDLEWHGADADRVAMLAKTLEYDEPLGWITSWR